MQLRPLQGLLLTPRLDASPWVFLRAALAAPRAACLHPWLPLEPGGPRDRAAPVSTPPGLVLGGRTRIQEGRGERGGPGRAGSTSLREGTQSERTRDQHATPAPLPTRVASGWGGVQEELLTGL